MAVTLVLSGSLLAGCGRREPAEAEVASGPVLTNNTYRSDLGYYHSHYHEWYPLPHNYYSSSSGYYYGGSWASTPDTAPTIATSPRVSSTTGGSSMASRSSSSSVSRSGFGSHGSAVS